MEKKGENGNGLNNYNFERVFPNSADNLQPPATLVSSSPVPPPARRFFEVVETFANPIDFNHPTNNFGNYYTDILQRLQGLRIESPVRGQMPDLNRTSPAELMRSLLAGSNRSPIINNGMQRNGLWSSNSNPNGFQSPYDSVNAFGRTDPRWSNINVFESENLMSSSLNNNHNNNLFRARSPPALVRGRLFWLAKDQHGCRLLQQKLEEGNPEEIQMIFSELKDHVLELMVEQFGNYVAQKLFKFCNAQSNHSDDCFKHQQ
ncbi:hypothetical protein F0562_020747 [Nyssa sinensis]|uniref:PUM-HD domain-containing protein n=1 Tax=Nyssa sinensis TaxID=561372 RepID=A0A5J5BW44_9ASTE|nr:hypothetical protein F0562_020747 [Nyssa sinensis]